LPATIEGAIRSGFAAAQLVIEASPQAFSSSGTRGDRARLGLTTETEQEQHRALS
jgi:hypothetical protein